MLNKVIALILFLFLSTEAFAMNPLAQLAVDLKQSGYPQALVIGDMTYGIKGDQYIEYRGDMSILPPDYVKVPQLVNIMNQVVDCKYTLVHSSVPDGNGGYDEIWQLSDSGLTWQDDNIWVVFAKYWKVKKGK